MVLSDDIERSIRVVRAIAFAACAVVVLGVRVEALALVVGVAVGFLGLTWTRARKCASSVNNLSAGTAGSAAIPRYAASIRLTRAGSART